MKIDWDNPKYHGSRIESLAKVPDGETRSQILDGAARKVHQILNNALRLCGAVVQDGNSEVTWGWVDALFQRAERYVAEDTKDRPHADRCKAEIATEDLKMIQDWVETRAQSIAGKQRLLAVIRVFVIKTGLTGRQLVEVLNDADAYYDN